MGRPFRRLRPPATWVERGRRKAIKGRGRGALVAWVDLMRSQKKVERVREGERGTREPGIGFVGGFKKAQSNSLEGLERAVLQNKTAKTTFEGPTILYTRNEQRTIQELYSQSAEPIPSKTPVWVKLLEFRGKGETQTGGHPQCTGACCAVALFEQDQGVYMWV